MSKRQEMQEKGRGLTSPASILGGGAKLRLCEVQVDDMSLRKANAEDHAFESFEGRTAGKVCMCGLPT